MNAHDAINATLDASDFVLKTYLKDMTDDDIKVIPLDGFNPIALQIGHLIASERMFVEQVKPGSCPPLPEGFADKHEIKSGDKSDPSRYTTLSQYLALWDSQRAATKAVLKGMSEAELSGPSGWERFPTVGGVINLAGIHAVGHAGQFVAVRRKLGKPIAF
jgi:hypothetical protein